MKKHSIIGTNFKKSEFQREKLYITKLFGKTDTLRFKIDRIYGPTGLRTASSRYTTLLKEMVTFFNHNEIKEKYDINCNFLNSLQ